MGLFSKKSKKGENSLKQQEKNDRTEIILSTESDSMNFSCILGILLKDGRRFEYEYYSNSDQVTKDELLVEFVFVNETEMALWGGEEWQCLPQEDLQDVQLKIRKKLPQPMVREEKTIEFSEQENKEENSIVSKGEATKLENLKIPKVVAESSFIEEQQTDGANQESEQLNRQETSRLEETQLVENENVEVRETTELKKVKSKKKTKKKPSIKKMSAKKFNWLAVAVVGIIVSTGTFALLRTYGIANRVSANESKIATEINQLKKETGREDETKYPFEMNQFMQEFISYYIPLSTDKEEMDERSEKLAGFTVKNLLFENSSSLSNRELIACELNNVTEHDRYQTAQYKVTYKVDIPEKESVENKETIEFASEKNSNEVVEKKEEIKTKEGKSDVVEKTAYLNIDFIESEGAFVVVSYPYFVKTQNYVLEGAELKNEKNTSDAVVGKELEEVKNFLAIFFEKYTSESEEEMKYLTDDIVFIGEDYTVKRIVDVEAFKVKEKVFVCSTVEFQEKETGIVHTEQFSMELVQKEGQYQIKKINHNLGGITE